MKAVKTDLIQKTLYFDYKVYLENGNTFSFKNHKQAKAFEVATNNFYNESIFEVNEIFSQLQSKYRALWHYINAQDTKIFNNSIVAITDLLDSYHTKAVFNPSVAFLFIQKSINYAAHLCNELLKVIANKSDTYLIKLFNLQLRNLRRVADELQTYGDKHPNLIECKILERSPILFQFEQPVSTIDIQTLAKRKPTESEKADFLKKYYPNRKIK